MRPASRFAATLFLFAAAVAVAQEPFQVTSKVDATTIAGRPVQLDAEGKLLPWPMPDNPGYSYSSHFLTQWSILWDLYNRYRYHYFFCCFDFYRTTFEMQPDWHWANSTAYLRAMLQGFIERLYPYTGDPNTITFLQDFIDSHNWVTYFQGMPAKAHSPWGSQWWFTDEFADGPRRLMDAFWAVPEWAPADESHLLGSHSVVTKIAYGRGSVTYSTFDPSSVDVLRLNFVPDAVWSGGRKLARRGDLKQEGYTFDDATKVLRIRHDAARDVDIQGGAAEPVPLIVDFDNPHVGANVKLRGEYPSGVIDWGDGAWKVCPPGGRMSTFSLGTAETDVGEAHFRFFYPRVLMRLDVYNTLPSEVKLTLRSPEMREVTFTLKPGQLQRLRTGWMNRVSTVYFESAFLSALRFDNLAYSPYLLARTDTSE
jgi:hypothetical protein